MCDGYFSASLGDQRRLYPLLSSLEENENNERKEVKGEGRKKEVSNDKETEGKRMKKEMN
jgi:hypothetical protein